MKTWSQSDIEYLTKAYAVEPLNINEMARVLKTTKSSIKSKAAQIGVTKSVSLTNEEMEFIKKNSKTLNIKWLSKKINRSWNTIYRALNILGIKAFMSYKWVPSKDEIEYLKSSTKNVKEMSIHLKKTPPTIRKHLKILGLKCPERVKVIKPIKVVKVTAKPPVIPRDIDVYNRIRESMIRTGYL